MHELALTYVRINMRACKGVHMHTHIHTHTHTHTHNTRSQINYTPFVQPVSRPQPDMYTAMAERSRQLAMEEFKAEAQGGTKAPPKSHSAHKLDETVDREEDSESSMPCSLPGDMEAGRSKRYGPYSVFFVYNSYSSISLQ